MSNAEAIVGHATPYSHRWGRGNPLGGSNRRASNAQVQKDVLPVAEPWPKEAFLVSMWSTAQRYFGAERLAWGICSSLMHYIKTFLDGADGGSRTRTGVAPLRILSPVCLPVPPRPLRNHGPKGIAPLEAPAKAASPGGSINGSC